MSKINGHNINIVELNTMHSVTKTSIGGKQQETHNILFIPNDDNNTYWLFEGNNQIIYDYEQIKSSKSLNTNNNVTKSIYYSTKKYDTNNNGKIDLNDDSTLISTDPTGKNMRELETFSKVISRYTDINNNTFTIFGQKDNHYVINVYDLDNWNIITKKIIKNLNL